MSFNNYLNEVFIPAQKWAESDKGKKGLHKQILRWVTWKTSCVPYMASM